MTTIKEKLSVAIPWSLSHYIPLNGFHPLYRALFEECPAQVTLNAWDNARLASLLRQEAGVRLALLSQIAGWRARLKLAEAPAATRRYFEAMDVPNLVATAALPGDIELHHTAPFPSMTRPFVLHCDAFAPLLTPVCGEGTGSIPPSAARAHYAPMLDHPLCLGIFSHLPDTLAAVSRFFDSPVIDAKLFAVRTGISGRALAQRSARAVRNEAAPTFLFITPQGEPVRTNFLQRGGDIVLRAWPAILRACPGARLYLHGPRPDLHDADGVDPGFMAREISNSIIFIEAALSNRELNNLMRAAHFFLAPGAVCDRVGIMQAMALGAVPVVADAVTAGRYLGDGQTGLVLTGDGVAQDELAARVLALWQDPAGYAGLQARSMAHAAAEFAGAAFADDFWGQVQRLWAAAPKLPARSGAHEISGLGDCLIAPHDWSRLFESPAQPVCRLHTGTAMVTELGGTFICTAPGMLKPHDWSVLTEYCQGDATPLLVASSIRGLRGAYLAASLAIFQPGPRRRFVQWVARQLSPYPGLYRAMAGLLHRARRLRARLRPPPAPPAPEVYLIEENVAGMNILRCGDLYYAIAQTDGAFSLQRLRKGDYRRCFAGVSARQVRDMIAADDGTMGQPGQRGQATELIEEGYCGLNLIRYGEMFVAIPQGEGAFDFERLITRRYSRSFTGENLADLKSLVAQVP